MDYQYSEITPEVIELAKLCTQKGGIDPSLYAKYEVKRGLRDINGKGVLAGLTEISEVHAMILLMGNLYRVKAGYITGESMLKILLQVLCAMSDSALRRQFTYYYLETYQMKNN